MSDSYLPIGEYIKQGIVILLVITLSLFGIKSCRKYQKTRTVVIQLSSHASESAAYEQFYKEAARENLIQAMHQMYLGEQLGLTPNEIIDKVMIKDDGILASSSAKDLSSRKSLIRDALLSNYDNCKKLGIFDDITNLTVMSSGGLPTITKGPASGETVVILPIIDNAVLQGADKLLPNMVISPPKSNETTKAETHMQRARAKLLAKSLVDAQLIERDAYLKLEQHYDQILEKKIKDGQQSAP